MRIIIFLLIIGTLVHGIGIDRAWDHQSWSGDNDDIFDMAGIEVWLNLNNFQRSLEQQELESMDDYDISKQKVNEKLVSAIEYRNRAAENKEMCWDYMESNGTKKIELDDEVVALILLGGTSAIAIDAGVIVGTGGVGTGVAVGTAGMAAAGIVAISVLKCKACIDYPVNWKHSMDDSLDALEISITEGEIAAFDAQEAYKEAERRGLCLDDYKGPGKTICKRGESAFKTAEANGTELEFGSLGYSIKTTEEVEDELFNPPPDMSNYSSAMGAIWSPKGAIKTYESLQMGLEEGMSSAEGEYDALKTKANTKRDTAQTEISKLESKHLFKIDKGISSDSTGDLRVGSIKERYYTLKNEFQDAKEAHEIAINHASGEDHYLAKGIGETEMVVDDFDSIKTESILLLENADAVVESKREDAYHLIQSLSEEADKGAQSTVFMDALASLEAGYENCEGKSTLGDRFVCYSNVEADAQNLNHDNTLDYSNQTETQNLILDIEEMLGEAKNDGIHVTGEEAEFSLLKTQKDLTSRTEYFRNIKERIIASAEDMYGHLEEEKTELERMIELAGPIANDLKTDMDNAEAGITFNPDGTIDYGNSIGKLKSLEIEYDRIRKMLELHKKDIIAGSMEGDVLMMTDEVRLDEPSSIFLDIHMKNGHEFSTENADVSMALPVSLDIFYSDITEGSERVLSVNTEDNTLNMNLDTVDPFENFHIRIEKEKMIAHTLESKKTVTGLGDGSARIDEEIAFDLDMGVDSFEAPDGVEDALVDGKWPPGYLSRGEHTLEYTRLVYDAYTERKENIRAYEMGLETEVSYDIVINPAMDIDKTMVYLESMNDSRITGMNVHAVTGEKITNKKQISASSYAAEIHDLQEGIETRIRFTYKLKDLEDYVDDQLDFLERGDHSPDTKDIIDNAEIHAGAGEYTKALEKIEEAKDVIDKEKKEVKKEKSKYDDIKLEMEEEVGQIDGALKTASELELDTPLIAKLNARKDELLLRINESNETNPSEALQSVDDVDLNWMRKELRSKHKSMYSEYNDLREKFAKAGNSTTPDGFIEFENELNRLGAGMRPEYAVLAEHYLEEIKTDVENAEEEIESELSSARNRLNGLKRKLESTSSDYSALRKSADDTAFTAFFDDYDSRSSDLADDIDDLISRKRPPELINHELSRLEAMEEEMGGTIGLMEKKAEDKYGLIRDLLSTKKDLGDEKRRNVEKGLANMKNMLDSGAYVDAIKLGDVLVEHMGKKKEEDHSLLILGVTAIVVLATIVIYVMQHKEELGLENKGNEKRKLPRKDEEEQ